MINTMRHIAIGALLAASISAGAQTQETNTVGNPQLKDFELPGTRTTPPPAEQQPAPPPPPPRAEPAEARTPPPAARPVLETRVPERAPARAATPPTAQERRTEPPAPPPEQSSAVATPPPPLALEPLPDAAPVQGPAPTESAPAAASPSEPDGFPWLYAALAALLALLAFAAFRKFNARVEEVEVADTVPAPQPSVPQAAPPPAPVTPVPAPAALAAGGGIVGIQIRPWLELEFKPDRAAATLTDASVQYELTIRNKGNAPARNIRIEARMFNAGPSQEHEIGAFFAEPVRERTPPALAILPPRGEIKLRNAITMPKEEVREITIQGRRLFIPTVAFNVIYDYGDNRSGQTSTSYIVGREAETPSEKMGAFRLDLGPRLYRSVGQRQTKLARIV